MNATEQDVNAAIDRLAATAMRMRRERDDLLKALKALLDISPFATDAASAKIHADAHIAIAKAKGR